MSTCFVCKESLPADKRQIGFLVDGVSESFHVHCGDEWANTVIEVFVIHAEDYGYTTIDKTAVLNELESLEVGDNLEIEKREMRQAEFYALKELNR